MCLRLKITVRRSTSKFLMRRINPLDPSTFFQHILKLSLALLAHIFRFSRNQMFPKFSVLSCISYKRFL